MFTRVLPQLASALALVLAISCDNPQDGSGADSGDLRSQLIGSWEYTYDDGAGGTQTWTDTYSADGTFSTHIVTTENGTTIEDVTNSGTWTLNGNNLTVDFAGQEIYRYQVSISGNTMTMKDIDFDETEVYTRV